MDLDKAFGALVIGSWTNCALFAWEVVEACRYFRAYSNDHWPLRASVMFALLVDTVGTISNNVGIYRVGVRNFGNPQVFMKQGLEIPMHCITSSLSGLVCHAYLTWRFLRLSKNRVVAAFLLVMDLIAVGFAMFTAHSVIIHSEYADREQLKKPVIVWMSLNFASDIAIAASLVFYLLRYTTAAFKQTKSVLYKLVITAIESGSVSSIVTVIVLVTYLTDLESNVPVGIAYNLGRIYSLTLLFNLNMRQSGLLAGGSNVSDSRLRSAAFSLSVGSRKPVTTFNQGDINLVPVEVRREVQIHTDSDDGAGTNDLHYKPDDDDSYKKEVPGYRSPV